jgi:hypothetical protein
LDVFFFPSVTETENFRPRDLMKTTTPRCKLCKKELTNPESIARGIGPECAEKFAWMLVDNGLTLEALEIPVQLSTDWHVARWLRLAECALLAGERDRVERFKTAAKEAARRLTLPAAA